MAALRDTEHFEFALIPTGDEIEPEAAGADMIGGDEFLGGDQRMKQRRMHGTENRDALRRGQKAAGPGYGFERSAMKIAGAAVAFPAPDRQQEIDAGRIGQFCQFEAVGPGRQPALRHQRGGAGGRAVGAEKPDLERIIAMHGDTRVHRCGSVRHELTFHSTL